jgi:hypothetical protein
MSARQGAGMRPSHAGPGAQASTLPRTHGLGMAGAGRDGGHPPPSKIAAKGGGWGGTPRSPPFTDVFDKNGVWAGVVFAKT